MITRYVSLLKIHDKIDFMHEVIFTNIVVGEVQEAIKYKVN
jgi:hypothetical protein